MIKNYHDRFNEIENKMIGWSTIEFNGYSEQEIRNFECEVSDAYFNLMNLFLIYLSKTDVDTKDCDYMKDLLNRLQYWTYIVRCLKVHEMLRNMHSNNRHIGIEISKYFYVNASMDDYDVNVDVFLRNVLRKDYTENIESLHKHVQNELGEEYDNFKSTKHIETGIH